MYYREGFTGKNPLPVDSDLEKLAARPITNFRGAGKLPTIALTPTVQKILDYAKTLNYDKQISGPFRENPEEQIYYFLIPENAKLFKSLRELVSNYDTKPSYDKFISDVVPVLNTAGFNADSILEKAKQPKTGAVGISISDGLHAIYDYIFEEGFSVESSYRPPPKFDYTSPKKSGTKCTPRYSQIPGGTDEVKCFS